MGLQLLNITSIIDPKTFFTTIASIVDDIIGKIKICKIFDDFLLSKILTIF